MKRQRSAHTFRQRFRQRRLIWSWFLTYTVILLLPILSSILIFHNDQRIIRDEIDRSNQTLLELTQQTIDQRFEELQLVSYQMTLNPRFRRFTSVGHTMTPAQRMNHYQLTQDMIAYSAANEFVERFFIYFENTECISRLMKSMPAL